MLIKITLKNKVSVQQRNYQNNEICAFKYTEVGQIERFKTEISKVWPMGQI
jgi:hypothetical protein